ncbi:MAG: HAMP domain-containing sensor histidine kinase [Bacteroidota bacterium]
MNLNLFLDWFTNAEFSKDAIEYKKARMLVQCSFLTSLFSSTYLLLSIYIEFNAGIYCMIFNVLGFLLLPFLLKRPVDLIFVGNLFIFLGALAISIIVYYSGGIWSPTLFWLAAVPVLAAFLVSRKSAISWGVLMYLLTMFFGIAEIQGKVFPVNYNENFRSIFLVVSASGFLLIILLIAVVFELSTRKAEKRLAIANKKMSEVNSEKDYIIQIMAHDLRNPLHIIKSWLDILKEDEKQVESPMEVYIMMDDSVKRSLRLIDKVTKIGAIEQENLQVVLEELDIKALIDDTIEVHQTHAKGKGISLIKSWNKESFMAKVDSTYFAQIVDNLVSNAVKYTRKEGKVNVSLQKVEDQIELRVHDEGPGISKDDQSKLFKKFSRLNVKPTGGESSTGVGLFLVKKYANLMNGDIRCESEPKRGSTFILSIPEISN